MRLLITLLFVTLTFHVSAQSPEKMSYQAIVRAQDNSLVVNSNVGLRIIVHQTSATGTIVYQETHAKTTNSNGLVSLEIGTGTNVSGNFSTIAWDKGPYYIETQVDAGGGTNYNIIGVTQLLSVPYALYAKSAGTNVSAPYKPVINSFTSSRNIASSDIFNTIECTTTGTLTLTSGFSAMAVGDTVNLEAHNGAVLTVQASSGVTINYNSGGTARFTSTTGNVRFGLLRKTGLNSYIISGQ